MERHLIVLVSRIQKRGTRDNNFVKWRGTRRSNQPKWPDRSKWTTFRAGHEYSGQTKPKWTFPLIWSTNQNFWNFGLKGNKVSLDSSLWRILRFAPRLHTAYLPNYFQLFLLKFCHTLLTNLTNKQGQKQLKTKILVEFKPGQLCKLFCVHAFSKYIVWFQKISIPPPWRELEIWRGWGGQRPKKFQRGGGLDDKNHFSKGSISNSVRKLLLTDLVNHFWRHK